MRSSVKKVRRAAIEALEGRCLMTATIDSLTLDNYTAPEMDGSAVVSAGSLVEGMGQTASLVFHTDHDNLDGGVCKIDVDYGDPSSPGNTATFYAAGYKQLSHCYPEAGSYAMSATVTDSSGDGTTYTFTSSSDSKSVPLVVAEGSLGAVTDNADYSFEPNSPFTLQVGMAEFSDTSSADLDPSEYSGTIDWGDGTGPATAAFEIDSSNRAVSVVATHTYNYVMDPGTGDIQHPVGAFGEKIDNPILIQVQEAGGGSLDINLMATVRARPFLQVGTSNPAPVTGSESTIYLPVPPAGVTNSKTFFVTGWDKSEAQKISLPSAPTMTNGKFSAAKATPSALTAPPIGKSTTSDPCTYQFTLTWGRDVVSDGANGNLYDLVFSVQGFDPCTLHVIFAGNGTST